MSGEKWPQEKDDLLRQLWLRGDTGTEIAQEMGITKNAVVGRAHRLRLPARLSPIKAGQRQNSAPRHGGIVVRRAAAGVVIPPAPAATSLGATGAPRPGAAAFSAQHDVSSRLNFPALAARLTNPSPARGFLDAAEAKREKVAAQPRPQVFQARGCQFPLWPHGPRVALEDMRFCDAAPRRNKECRQDSAYCAEHHARCFAKMKESA
ncbi:MAG: GcrA family cell cycle regulator [Opitutia bacterium]